MGTENIGGIDVVIQAHDAQYNAAMRRAAATARQTGGDIARALRANDLGGAFDAMGKRADTVFSRLGQRFGSLARDMRGFQYSLAATMGSFAGFLTARAFVDKAGGFEQQLEIMRVVSGATADAMGRARTQALALGAATARSANDIAGAQLELSKMGFSMERILELTPAVTNLSIAADMEMSAAAKTAGAIMRQFGLQTADMENVMDVIMRGANQSAADVSDFAGSLRYAGAMARAANVDLETTVAILEAASNAGMEGFMAGTSFRSLLGDFNTPTPQAAQIFKQFNIQLRDADGQLRNILDLMEEVVTKIPRNMIGPPLFEVDSSNLLNALTAGGVGIDNIRAMEADLHINQTGEAARTAEARMKGLRGAIETLSGAFETLLIKIGDSGFLKSATEMVRGFAQWVSGLNETQLGFQGLIGWVGLAVTALIPLQFAFSTILKILTSPEGLITGLASFFVTAGAFYDITAAIKGTNESLARTKNLVDAVANATRGWAGASRDVQAAMLSQQAVALRNLQLEADRANRAAAQAEAADPLHTKPLGGGLGDAFLATGHVIVATVQEAETRHETAVRLRADAEAALNQAREAYAAHLSVMQEWADSDPATVEARRVSAERAQATLDAARAATPRGERFDYASFWAANPGVREALAAPAYGAGLAGGGLPAPVPAQTRFMGFTPMQGIQRETEMMERFVEVAWQGQRAVDALQEALTIRDQSLSPLAGPNGEPRYDLSLEQARAIQAQREYSRQAIAIGALNDETERSIADQQRLNEAAADGERAYERMRIQLELLRSTYGLTEEEAAALAERMEESAHQATRAQERMSAWAQTMRDVGQTIAGAFESAITQGGKLIDVLRNMAKEIVMLVLRATVIKPIADWISGILNGGKKKEESKTGKALSIIGDVIGAFGGRAHGGPVWAGGAYRVGEQGPELFVPNASGRIVSAAQMAGGGGGGGGATIVYSPSYQFTGTAEEIAAVKRMVANDRQRFAAQVRGVVGDLQHRGRMG